MDGWIDLVEYASKYGISQSTLRRRIRSNTVTYKMERGKYLVQDSADALKSAPLFSRGLGGNSPRQSVKSHLPEFDDGAFNQLRAENDRLIEDNRRLKAQIAELETLVGVLETELSPKA